MAKNGDDVVGDFYVKEIDSFIARERRCIKRNLLKIDHLLYCVKASRKAIAFWMECRARASGKGISDKKVKKGVTNGKKR